MLRASAGPIKNRVLRKSPFFALVIYFASILVLRWLLWEVLGRPPGAFRFQGTPWEAARYLFGTSTGSPNGGLFRSWRALGDQGALRGLLGRFLSIFNVLPGKIAFLKKKTSVLLAKEPY